MRRYLVFAILWLAWATAAHGQGRTSYLNVESPQVHPIEVAEIGGHSYLLIANTPDNSVEIWDTDESITNIEDRFIARVRVGLEPVSVRFHPGRSWLYTANFLGDSISIVELSSPAPGSVDAELLLTAPVGDEPMDLAFFGQNHLGQTQETLFVTHMTLDAYGWRDALTLAALPGFALADAWAQGNDIDGDGVADQIAIKEPRAVAVNCGKVFVLGAKGGNESADPVNNPTYFDFGLWMWDPVTDARTDFGGLGSNNLNMAFDSTGSLFVVGGDARNEEFEDEAEVADAETGFVESFVWMIDDPCGTNPQIKGRDVNLRPLLQPQPGGPVALRSSGQPAIQQANAQPYGKAQALAQLTSVVAYEPAGGTRKVFFTAFGSDRVGVLEPDFQQAPLQWPRRRINISLAGAPNIAKAGPRGLALGEDVPGTGGKDRLYVLNRLENSFTILDPDQEVELDQVVLNHDPRPDYIKIGQRFLYDAKLSGNGFSSCASCHVDGRTDGLAWDLSTPEEPGDLIPPLLDDMILNPFVPNWPDDKGLMVTQSLQGLLNFELEPATMDLVTNAPYHWRGDRVDFVAFNAAFPNLLKRTQGELDPTEMDQFEEYVNSIHYPPNPKQPITRTYSGQVGDPNSVTGPGAGSGAQLGMKFYHITTPDGRTCAHCHALPEGSNNKLTEFISSTSPFDRDGGGLPNQPIDTAALRGLFQKEARIQRSGSDDTLGAPITGLEGVFHTGYSGAPFSADFNNVATINSFNQRFFSNLCSTPPGLGQICAEVAALNQFVHEMDWGVAPRVGYVFTADDRLQTDPSFLGATNRVADHLEDQAGLVNIGLAVHLTRPSGDRGFWFDLSATTPVYREEPGGGSFTRQDLYALVVGPDDRLVFEGTPLGSDRRVASPQTSVPDLGSDLGPSKPDLLGMRPNTAYAGVPAMDVNWARLDPADPTGTQYLENFGGYFPHVVRLLQHGLLQDTVNNGFGLDRLRHDAPRRFVVAVEGALPGAFLRLRVHDDSDPLSGPPLTGRAWNHPAQPGLRTVEIPLYPSAERTADDRPVWQTAVELEPLMYYRMMNGGPYAPGVDAAWNDSGPPYAIDEPPPTVPQGNFEPFDPDTWNWVWVEVENPDGKVASGGWQRVTLQ